MDTRRIDPILLPAFRPYLLPEAAQAVEEGDSQIIAVGAVTKDARTCGAAAALLDEEGFALFSLYVDPQVRRRGVASLLLDALEREGGQPLTEACWALSEEEAAPLEALLQRRGFGPTEWEDGGVMRLDTRVMRTLPAVRRAFSPNFRPDGNIVAIKDVTQSELADLLADGSIDPALRLDNFTPEQLSSPMCLGYRYGGRIAAYFLAEPAADGAAVLAAVSRQGCHAGAFLQLATAAIHNSLPYLPGGDGYYWLEAVNDTADKLARHFCGDEFTLWRTGHARREL